MAEIQDFDFKRKAKSKNAERAVLGALLLFFCGVIFFAYVSFDALTGKKSPRLTLNISKKITEPEEILAPPPPTAPAPTADRKTEAKTEQTDDLMAMLAAQEKKIASVAAASETKNVQAEKKAENVSAAVVAPDASAAPVPSETSAPAGTSAPASVPAALVSSAAVAPVPSASAASAAVPVPPATAVTAPAAAPKKDAAPVMPDVPPAAVPAAAPKKDVTPAASSLPERKEELFIDRKADEKKRPPAQVVLEDRVPLPDLVEGALLKSLPNFGNIKVAAPLIAPLTVITPLPNLRDADGRPVPFTEKGVTQTPFDSYKRPAAETLPKNIPFVAILLSGVGMRENSTSSAVNALPSDVSLSYSPYTTNLEKAVSAARQAGHETFLDLPMQVGVFPAVDPGPVGVVAGLPERENKRRLMEILSKNVAFIGLTGTVEETFSKTSPQMGTFVEELRRRNLVYVNSSNDFKETSANVLTPDVVIYKNFYRAAIKAQLEKAREIALRQGHALIHARAVPVVMLTMLDWIESFEKKGDEKDGLPPEVVFVPVSYLAERVLKDGK